MIDCKTEPTGENTLPGFGADFLSFTKQYSYPWGRDFSLILCGRASDACSGRRGAPENRTDGRRRDPPPIALARSRSARRALGGGPLAQPRSRSEHSAEVSARLAKPATERHHVGRVVALIETKQNAGAQLNFDLLGRRAAERTGKNANASLSWWCLLGSHRRAWNGGFRASQRRSPKTRRPGLKILASRASINRRA